MYVNSDDEDGYDDHLLDDFDRNWISVGMKVGCAWTCGLVYLVYLLFPGKYLLENVPDISDNSLQSEIYFLLRPAETQI